MVEVAVGSGAPAARPGIPAGLAAWLAGNLAAEADRRILWAPVFFGIGIGVYFQLPAEPPLWIGAAAGLVLVGLAWICRRQSGQCQGLIALSLVAFGFGWMSWTTSQRDAPSLQRRLGPVAVTARVIDVETVEKGWRLVVAPDPLPGLDAAAQPRRIRIHVPAGSDAVGPGDRVGFKALIYPPPGPILPYAQDFQREAFFARIGGVGYSYGKAHRLAEAEGSASGSGEGDTVHGSWSERLLALRATMTEKIIAVLPGPSGGMASALITGKRGTIPEPVKQTFRDTGLSHLLAIAGLHLGLVGGFVFFATRAGLALIPPIALRYPIKKIAAAITLAVLLCYLLISGAAIPTERAFVMNGLVFGAILLDRLRLSMRVCAIAAAIVLAVEPQSLVGVSFQMSFGAVVALIAVYESWGRQIGALFHGHSFARHALGYCGGVALTTLVATVGTDPFSIYHFHRLALYSPLANVIAVPLSAVWTLPWGVVACLLMPFGLERLALIPMGWGIDLTMVVAQWVAALPGNVWMMPRLPAWGLVILSFGGLWLCLWQTRWRYWGLAAIAFGFATMGLTRPPDIVVADNARFIALRLADGHYIASGEHGQRMSRSMLADQTGEAVEPWPAGDLERDGLSCKQGVCRYEARGRSAAIRLGDMPPPRECSGDDVMATQGLGGFRCRDTMMIVDRIDTWRNGSAALWLDAAGVAVETARSARGERPWVPMRKAQRKAAPDRPAPGLPPLGGGEPAPD